MGFRSGGGLANGLSSTIQAVPAESQSKDLGMISPERVQALLDKMSPKVPKTDDSITLTKDGVVFSAFGRKIQRRG